MADDIMNRFEQLLATPIRMYTPEEMEARKREAKRESEGSRITTIEFFNLQVRVEELEKQVKYLMSQLGPINITENM